MSDKMKKAKVNVAKKLAVPKRKAVKGYIKPTPIKLGTVLTDLGKKQWKVGPTIGTGGFGDIYLASSVASSLKSFDAYPNVVKIEPHGNGPLFVEMHFYMRNAKLDEIQAYKKNKGLTTFGMPHFVANGSEDINGDKHRFIVLPRYGKDIWSIFLKNDRKIPQHTVYRLAIEIINVLEYIHKCTYVHADIKGANLLLGFGKNGESEIYLVDFGLASHYTTKDFKPDPKKMHNGTIEYTSRDAHNGVPTMRGDFEILGYNLVHWLGAELPWEAYLDKPIKVQESKENFMKNIEKSLNTCFSGGAADSIIQYLKYVQKLEYNESPDYNKCRKIFESGLKTLGKKNVGIFEFIVTKEVISTPQKKTLKTRKEVKVERRTPRKRPFNNENSDESDIEKKPSILASPKKISTPQRKLNTNIKTTENIEPSGITIVNNIKKSQKPKKTYEFNFELNVSMDADIIVNVNRKRKSTQDLKDEQLSKKNVESNEGNDSIVATKITKGRPKRK